MTKKCSDEELEILITACVIRRYTTKESLEFIRSFGHKITERTFYARKSRMNKDFGKKTRFILENLLAEHLRGIEELQEVIREQWIQYKNTMNEILKLKISNSIVQNRIQLSKFIEETYSIIEKQLKWFNFLPIGNKLDVKKSLEKKKKLLETPCGNPHELIDITALDLNDSRRRDLEEFIEAEEIDNARLNQ